MKGMTETEIKDRIDEKATELREELWKHCEGGAVPDCLAESLGGEWLLRRLALVELKLEAYAEIMGAMPGPEVFEELGDPLNKYARD